MTCRAALAVSMSLLASVSISTATRAGPLPPDATYRPLPTVPFDAARKADIAAKPVVMERQSVLLAARYDLTDQPIPGVKMSGGRKTVQGGVRVKLAAGTTWDQLASVTADEIRAKGVFPAGFLRLPHVKQASGGQVFPREQIEQIALQEQRDLKRFDVEFDLPNRSHPEYSTAARRQLPA